MGIPWQLANLTGLTPAPLAHLFHSLHICLTHSWMLIVVEEVPIHNECSLIFHFLIYCFLLQTIVLLPSPSTCPLNGTFLFQWCLSRKSSMWMNISGYGSGHKSFENLYPSFTQFTPFFFLSLHPQNTKTIEKTRIYQSHLNGGLCRGFATLRWKLDDRMQEYPR